MKNAIHVIILLVLLIPGRLVAQQELKAHRTFGLDCMQCHTTADWKTLKKDIEFDHRLTGYTLRGNHASASCAGCHAETAFSQLKTDCVACHEDQHRGEFGERCSDCHTPSGWRSPNEDVSRHQLTRFPLLGAHALADCQQCHVNQEEREYVNTPTECYACHQQDYEQAKEPDHIAGDFSRDCAQCHDMGDGGWKGAFEHPVIPFMQTAAHVNLECSDCHVSGYAGTPRDCFGCHEADYRAVQQPNHVAGGYDRDCTVCHEPVHWSPATFDHNLTAFPLQGAHAATPCTSCHESGFGKLPTDCWSCHEQDYRAVAFPNHVDGQFSQDCMVCHNVNAWSPADFDHSLTNFRLTGAHVRTACQSCHVGGQYSGLPLDCQGCHDEDYNRTSQPDHALVGFDRQCEECHNTEAWQPIERMPISIDHDKTRFPLLGAHRTTDCVECHAGLVFAGTPVECFACHEKDFNDAKNPDHVAGSFDRECTTCHNMDAWKPADFDHARTAFPLEGAHAAEPCVSCHVNGDYNITYVDCWQCHETDYNASTQPNHVSAQFAHECTTCHNTTAWVPSTFDHAQTNFPLTGAHASQACESCHIGGDYNITYTDCWQCHETDYNATTQPNHVSAQFAHECTTCHSTTSWVPSTFDHAQTNFPLTGAHATQACESCHIGGDYNITYT
ncbi:hypothetical protein KQI65_04780, partial [bacterium]|nr:hypothetical protein [bacterium]